MKSLCTLLAMLAALPAFAQSDKLVPGKPVRLLIPAAPGGNPDVLARAMIPKMQASLGVPIVVDNQPGGGGIGGAMDLISGRTELIIVMEHCDSKGRPKLKKKCKYPLTGQGCVSYVVTDLALLKWNKDRFELLETAPGFSAEDVIALTETEISVSPQLKSMA